MVIAFDFDGTLSDERIQMLAKKMRSGNELWVVTARSDSDFNRGALKSVLNKLGLTEHQVIFCNEKPKWEYLKGINADVYIDNVSFEFENILNKTNTIPLLWQL
jgi:hypothetical protein